MTALAPYKQEFIEFLLQCSVLKFGDFTTKSGRKTPFFINTGEYKTGSQMNTLARYYAKAATESFGTSFDNLFGPAYKGIPLSVATAMALSSEYDTDVTYTFNRKEAKDHGEGGSLVGYKYTEPAKSLIVEDVTTAGTSIRETFEIVKEIENFSVVGLLISVDRMEKVEGGVSALTKIESDFGIKTASIVTILDIIAFISDTTNREKFTIKEESLENILEYRKQYGA
ncbi:MAG: orotate phosphoribosyltransferase [Fibrobacterales bacterium]